VEVGGGGTRVLQDTGVAGTANTGGGGLVEQWTKWLVEVVLGGSGIVIVKELNKASGSWPLRAQFSARKSGTWPNEDVEFDYLVVAGGGGRWING
jgi:hypothetical protein